MDKCAHVFCSSHAHSNRFYARSAVRCCCCERRCGTPLVLAPITRQDSASCHFLSMHLYLWRPFRHPMSSCMPRDANNPTMDHYAEDPQHNASKRKTGNLWWASPVRLRTCKVASRCLERNSDNSTTGFSSCELFECAVSAEGLFSISVTTFSMPEVVSLFREAE